MASINETEKLVPRRPRGSFVDRYPDYPTWLDGNVWELDVETEIDDSLENFRCTMHYQAHAMGLQLVTKTRYREEDGVKRRKLLIQAHEA